MVISLKVSVLLSISSVVCVGVGVCRVISGFIIGC